jgi:hypothetical protein
MMVFDDIDNVALMLPCRLSGKYHRCIPVSPCLQGLLLRA